MKKYIIPEIEFASFDTEDIMQVSLASTQPSDTLTVGGESIQTMSYGQQDFSIFDKQ